MKAYDLAALLLKMPNHEVVVGFHPPFTYFVKRVIICPVNEMDLREDPTPYIAIIAEEK